MGNEFDQSNVEGLGDSLDDDALMAAAGGVVKVETTTSGTRNIDQTIYVNPDGSIAGKTQVVDDQTTTSTKVSLG